MNLDAKFVIEIVLIGGGGLLFKSLFGLLAEFRESRRFFLNERKMMLEERNSLRESFQESWERLFSEIKPAMEGEAELARRVADEFYRPVLDAIWRVEIYADVFDAMEICISAANELISTGEIPEDAPPMVRDALIRYPDTSEFLQAMKEGLPSCADILCRQLDAFYQALEKLIASGYFSELEAAAGIDNLKIFLNCYYAANLPAIIANPKVEDVSRFLAKWKMGQFEPLRKLRRDVPWHVFLSVYYRSLRDSLKKL